MTHVQPYHQFRVTVAQQLKQRWNGANAYRLVEKFSELVHQSWLDNKLATETAEIVDRAYMDATAPQNVALPTRESLERVGCNFIKVS
jgi:hypothetical protein